MIQAPKSSQLQPLGSQVSAPGHQSKAPACTSIKCTSIKSTVGQIRDRLELVPVEQNCVCSTESGQNSITSKQNFMKSKMYHQSPKPLTCSTLDKDKAPRSTYARKSCNFTRSY